MLDDHLDATARARLEAHLAACDACRQAAAGLASARAALQAMPHVDAPRSFRLSPDQVASRETAPTPRNRTPALRFAAAAVGAVVLDVIGVQVFSNTGGGSDSSANRALSVQSAATSDTAGARLNGSPAAAGAFDSAATAQTLGQPSAASGAVAPPDTAQPTPPAASVANGAGEAASPPVPGPGAADNAASTPEAAPRAAAGADKAASTPEAASPAPVSTDSDGGNKLASPIVWILVAVVLAVPIGAVAWRLRRRWTS